MGNTLYFTFTHSLWGPTWGACDGKSYLCPWYLFICTAVRRSWLGLWAANWPASAVNAQSTVAAGSSSKNSNIHRTLSPNPKLLLSALHRAGGNQRNTLGWWWPYQKLIPCQWQTPSHCCQLETLSCCCSHQEPKLIKNPCVFLGSLTPSLKPCDISNAPVLPPPTTLASLLPTAGQPSGSLQSSASTPLTWARYWLGPPGLQQLGWK